MKQEAYPDGVVVLPPCVFAGLLVVLLHQPPDAPVRRLRDVPLVGPRKVLLRRKVRPRGVERACACVCARRRGPRPGRSTEGWVRSVGRELRLLLREPREQVTVDREEALQQPSGTGRPGRRRRGAHVRPVVERLPHARVEERREMADAEPAVARAGRRRAALDVREDLGGVLLGDEGRAVRVVERTFLPCSSLRSRRRCRRRGDVPARRSGPEERVSVLQCREIDEDRYLIRLLEFRKSLGCTLNIIWVL
jgi:hypothetical protein